MSNFVERIKAYRIERKTLKAKRKIIRDKNKAIEDNIKSLVKLGKYDEIFSKYGKDAYLKYVPNRIINKEYEKLKKEGRYEDIFIKLGLIRYDKALKSAMYNEIRQEQGIVKASIWRIKKNFIDNIKNMITFGIYGFAFLLGSTGVKSMEIGAN